MHFFTIFVIACLISSGVYLGGRKFVARAVILALALVVCGAAMIWGGPLSSGALFLLLPPGPQTASFDLPARYRPRHQGHVDLATGLYIREDEDIVLADVPWFVWRRAYLSGYHAARELGIGTTHNAELYLSGDPTTFQRVDLIREDGARIVFDRTSRGSSYQNAMFIHTATATRFFGARLGWVGHRWAMRFENGALTIFQDCGPGPGRICSIVSARDPKGRVVQFNRDEQGHLRSVEAGTQRVTLEYDDRHRIVHAVAGRHAASYSYDRPGRLVRATVDGTTRSYEYGSRDEMTLIKDPARTIENTYDGNLRLARQVVHRSGRPDYIEAFDYAVEGGKVLETTVTENDGSRTTYRWNRDRQQELELHESESASPIMVQFARAGGNFVRSITVFCKNDGRPVSETADVTPGDEEFVKTELIGRVCN